MISIPTDKKLHLLAGLAIAGAAHPFGLLVAFIVLLVAAIANEVWDYFFGGTVDAYDALATVWAGALMLGWVEITQAYA
jgi:hypothetical protein